MSIKISKTLLAELPASERPDAEQVLREKSKGHCYLCLEPFNWASDAIEADHDLPKADLGPTTLDNLNLAHVDCNRAKRNAKTVPIRPYLQLKAFLRKHGPLLKYDGVLPHFGIEPTSSEIQDTGDTVTLHLAHGSPGGSSAQVFSETNLAGTFRFIFVSLPRSAIFNDDKVQPRTIKEGHVWRIYVDLQHNPLNEPPSARIAELNKLDRILLFDGQHKTIASWMMGRSHVVAKVYLAMTEQQARRLVNSVQSGVPKLPLSPFELAAKMEEEWQDRLGEYEAEVGTDDASEAGFFKWLPQIDRARARSAFREAIIQTQLDGSNLAIRDFVRRTGEKDSPGKLLINEATLKNKVLVRMLHTEPLDAKGAAFQAYRAIERENVALLLNAFVDFALTPESGEAELSPAKSMAAHRMLYQSSLSYLSDLMLKIFKQFTMVDNLGSHQLTESESSNINKAIERIVNHPVWTAPYNRDSAMESIRGALEKNQEAKKSFEGVALDLAYAVVGAQHGAYTAYWRNDD